MATKTTSSEREPEKLYSQLPSVNDLLLEPAFSSLVQANSHNAVVHATRAVLLRLKQEISEGLHTQASLQERLVTLDLAVSNELTKSANLSLRRVINATGVILHTNLGRAPLSAAALAHMVAVAQGYSNLELDLESGERSRRDVHVEQLLLGLLQTRAGIAGDDLKNRRRAAVVVNNCAAATFLGLNSLADGAEVVVSRGELVEIGGGFRIPEILAKSGAHLREVGTTNRTRLYQCSCPGHALSDCSRILRLAPWGPRYDFHRWSIHRRQGQRRKVVRPPWVTLGIGALCKGHLVHSGLGNL